ncbi:glycosyltransferase [Rossellomorea vietnamensis]|uniref:Glycosyltransferase n=1 Tax=Rossellomorea vietnamensis TaxID=218284 RepID=A0A5D4MKY5_9BACI|nr:MULTISPECIES: glycosyltransferase [Bacillaceae]TYS01651.1 glycosyltransferase [Rossellomorea vietnamensis]
MHNTMRILILTAHYGEGHVQTAQTLADTFIEKGVQNVHVCDLYGEAYPAVHSFAQTLLKKSFSKLGAPLYKVFYYGTDKLSTKGLSYFYQHLGKKRLIELFQMYRPDIIITTFPMHAGAYLRSRPAFNIPTYTVITDYCAHPLWTHPLIEQYYVASQQVKSTLTKFGVNDKQISVTGIPIRKGFNTPPARSPGTFHKFGLDPSKKTVVIAGGGLGLLPDINVIYKELNSCKIQIVLMTGRNSDLMNHLSAVYNSYDNIKIFGYLENILELMSVTDCLVTKPGAITLTEAASLNIPVILVNPNPGQEAENAQFFTSKGAAIIAKKSDSISSYISSILSDEVLRQQFSNGYQSIYKREAALKIADDILDRNSHIHQHIGAN